MNSVFAMSAKLSYALLFVVAIASFPVATADDGGNSRTGYVSVWLLREKTRHLLVEEVDDNGRSEVKELELPEYEDSEEVREDEKRRREQRKEFAREGSLGCDATDDRERRRCLQERRKKLRTSYRNWREAMRRVLRDVDARIEDLGAEIGENA
ncbi:UNVERIFIED_CONTAM: hypothetical protein PYX00_008418 [Menopon gallinae]|uniref:Uncharacterized protein n=1 Tax=Menopon gallinae TaxID=328185 RepID=A0AAW2HNG0_9NEOP